VEQVLPSHLVEVEEVVEEVEEEVEYLRLEAEVGVEAEEVLLEDPHTPMED